ncbi:MAG: formate--tetrahydrofolate ligase [Candidatus Margulisiibacteriota bacterium]
MLNDIEIAQKARMKQIVEIAKKAGIKTSELEMQGCYKAKISLNTLKRLKNKKDGKLILVTTMSPTSQGEGKTTTTIGLAQALQKLGKKAIVCIREPSLGPVMGLKGGAAGGGYSQVLPMDDINLHLTGDMHMITSAHNLLSAMLYNHIYQGNELNIDENRIVWKRTMDMNDRALRELFDITASSEVMAVLCLSKSVTDMKKRLGEIIVAYNKSGQPVRAKDLKANGAMAMLLWHALKPNLVQTIEGGPVLIHGGPFANIAHGCNSLVATQLALKLADYVITEAGFATDLGAEKFFDIKCRIGKLKPAAAVLVVTRQAIEKHGYENVHKHIENIQLFGVPLVIAVNRKQQDPESEIDFIVKQCEKFGVPVVVSDIWAKGGKGGVALGNQVIRVSGNQGKVKFQFLYDLNASIKDKINTIATRIYGADGVEYSEKAQHNIELLEKIGFGKLPICIAKTQYSLSDDPKAFGRPKGFNITIRELKPSAGAGFIVAYAGNILTMPGLPKNPAAEKMDISEDGKITGLF